MKQSFQHNFKAAAQTHRPSVAERKALRERVLAYMEYHPLPERTTAMKARAYSAEPFVSVRLNTLYTRIAGSVLGVLLLIGVPSLAERAVPGDVLYPVKVRFNEEVRSTFTLSPYEKVAWETKRLERRVAEARLLASEGKLTEAFEVEVAEAVLAHTEAAQEEIEALRADDAEEAAIAEITFASALEVQSVVLASDESATSTGESVLAIADAVAVAQDVAFTEKGTTTPSYDRLLGHVEQETTSAAELLATIRTYASEAESADITRRLEDIARKVNDAQADRVENETAARALLTEALADTRKLITFMTDIDVRTHVSVEALVPVELTQEERTATLEALLAEASSTRPVLAEAVSALADERERAKAESAFATFTTHLTQLTAALSVGDVAAGEMVAFEVQAYLRDIHIMIDTASATPTDNPTASSTPATTSSSTPVVEGVASSTDQTVSETDPVVDPTNQTTPTDLSTESVAATVESDTSPAEASEAVVAP